MQTNETIQRSHTEIYILYIQNESVFIFTEIVSLFLYVLIKNNIFYYTYILSCILQTISVFHVEQIYGRICITGELHARCITYIPLIEYVIAVKGLKCVAQNAPRLMESPSHTG
jgi:hypothetical protein